MNYYSSDFQIERKVPRLWTSAEFEKLREMRLAGFSCAECGAALGRTKSAVCAALYRVRQEGGFDSLIEYAPKTPLERQFTTKIEVQPEQYADARTCFRCGSRWGRCEHTKVAA